MSAFHILVVESDPWTVKMVTSLLTRRGHRVVVAHSGSEAERQLSLCMPDLVIGDIQLDGEGLAWLTRLRAELGQRVLPALLLAEDAPPALRMEALRVPQSDFLDKPFRFDEFDLRVERLLPSVSVASRPASAPGPSEEPPRSQGLHGTLSDLSLASLLLLIESERKSGVLTVQRPGAVGRLWCSAGRLLSAELTVAEQRPERSLDAVFILLSWKSGDFEFVAGPEEHGDDEGLHMTQLVLLLAQRQDESARMESVAV
jgi:DNA-binding response OmpR family regulator